MCTVLMLFMSVIVLFDMRNAFKSGHFHIISRLHTHTHKSWALSIEWLMHFRC